MPPITHSLTSFNKHGMYGSYAKSIFTTTKDLASKFEYPVEALIKVGFLL